MKILILHTGGTISCSYRNGALSPCADIGPAIGKMFKNYRDVKLFHRHLPPVLSENTDAGILNRITCAVKKAVFSSKYDGVIVTVGSDALAYTCAAISYTVGLSSTPCVAVCSDMPLSVQGASGIANLKAAVAVIRSKKARGALTVYPDADGAVSVFRASRIMQQPLYFSAPVPAGKIYGTVKDGEFSLNKDYKEVPDTFVIKKPRFSTVSPVYFLSVYPGMVYPAMPRRIKAVILGSYHSGTVSTASAETVKFAKRCKKRGVRVYVSGISGGADYESMRVYEELGLIRLPAYSSPSAMLIKLWLLNSSTRVFTDELLFSPLGGDLSNPNETVKAKDCRDTQKSSLDDIATKDKNASSPVNTVRSDKQPAPDTTSISDKETI